MPEPHGPDDDAQMMLLAAVLLVIGFIALAGLVSVAQRLGEETLQEETSVVLLQTPPLLAILDALVAAAEAQHGAADLGNTLLDDAVEDAMRHLQRIAFGQGFLILPGAPGGFVQNGCDGAGGGLWTVVFELADTATQLHFDAAQRAC